MVMQPLLHEACSVLMVIVVLENEAILEDGVILKGF